MAYQYFNNNPCKKNVGDCVIRAISCALDIPWEEAYLDVSAEGLRMCDMPSSNPVWKSYLRKRGYREHLVPDGYTVQEFVLDNPDGIFVITTDSHVVCAMHGDYYDAWDSGNEVVETVFRREI